jgi:hypothetical protein
MDHFRSNKISHYPSKNGKKFIFSLKKTYVEGLEASNFGRKILRKIAKKTVHILEK